MKKYNVAVVGVGAVGIEMLRCLKGRKFPIARLVTLARSSRKIEVDGDVYSVQQIKPELFDGIDIALFAGTEGEKGASRLYSKDAIERGTVVIDNGSDFRLEKGVPLIIPEVNPDDIKQHRGLIASPNCTTIQMVVALAPLHREAKIKRIVLASYQAASGAGRSAVEELYSQSKSFLKDGKINPPNALPRQIAFNVFPQIGKFEDMGYTQEEWKCVRETHKILHDDSMKIAATCVRVPVEVGHSEAIYIETEKVLDIETAKDILRNAPGIELADDGDYPLPVHAAGKDEVFIGRVRRDPFVENALSLWVVSDNLLKGAALNTVQIAELLIRDDK